MATNKNLGTADAVTTVQLNDSLLAEVGGSVRRLQVGKLKEYMAEAITTQPTEYTLEGSSSPIITVTNSWAAHIYLSYMGGYMMKKSGGTMYAAKLHASNWDKFADGTAVDDASKYETMVRVPPCNFKASGKTMQLGGLSAIEGGHTFDSPQWVGAYKLYIDGQNKGHSRPDVAPSGGHKIVDFWSFAQNTDSQFGLANYQFHCLINALYQAIYCNLDSQTMVGSGWQSGNKTACRSVVMGLTRSLGDGSGSVLYNDSTLGDQHPTKLFGFEDLWGKMTEFRSGIRFYMDGTTRYACVYSGNQVSNTASGRTFPCLSSLSGTYASQMQLGEYWDMIPQAVSGSSTTYYCDNYNADTNGQVMTVGGNSNGYSQCGISNSSTTILYSGAWSDIGARIAYYGTPVIISGAELMAM